MKAIEDQGERQIKALEEHGKHLVESNELIRNVYRLITKKKNLKALLMKEWKK